MPLTLAHASNDLDTNLNLGPSGIGRQDALGPEHHGGRDDQRVGEPDPSTVERAEFGRSVRNFAVRWLDGRRQRIEERVDEVALRRARAEWRNEHLRVGRSRNHECVASLASGRESRASSIMVGIGAVQVGNDDPRVDDGQAHSRRRSSRYPSG